MPTTLLPPSIEAALVAKPTAPRLVAWFEWPIKAACFASPLTVLGTYLAGWLARGPIAAVAFGVSHLLILAIVVKGLALSSPKHLLERLMSKRGQALRLAEWLQGAWHRPALLAVAAVGPTWAYCVAVEALISPWLRLMSQAPMQYPVVSALAIYLGIVTIAALWGLLRVGRYNRDFRERFQLFKRAMDDLGGFRRREVWEAVRALPRVDFDGRRSRRGEPTPTALTLMRALQARGYRLADAPGREVDGPRLIPEYELVALKRGRFNYRADLAIVCPGKNVKLDIELDGGYHDTPVQQIKDGVRNQTFLNRGWAVVRFRNEEVERDSLACAEAVERVLTMLEQVPLRMLDDRAAP